MCRYATASFAVVIIFLIVLLYIIINIFRWPQVHCSSMLSGGASSSSSGSGSGSSSISTSSRSTKLCGTKQYQEFFHFEISWYTVAEACKQIRN